MHILSFLLKQNLKKISQKELKEKEKRRGCHENKYTTKNYVRRMLAAYLRTAPIFAFKRKESLLA